jgi:hypothetical protein
MAHDMAELRDYHLIAELHCQKPACEGNAAWSTVFRMDSPLSANTCVLRNTHRPRGDVSNTGQETQEHMLEDSDYVLSLQLVSENDQRVFQLANMMHEDGRYEDLTEDEAEDIFRCVVSCSCQPSMEVYADEGCSTNGFESAGDADSHAVVMWTIIIGDPQAPDAKIQACAHFHAHQLNTEHALSGMAVCMDPDIDCDEHGLASFNDLVCHLEGH